MVLARLQSDTHLENGRMKPDFPYLRGDKIGPLWLRMLRDNIKETRLKNLDRVPIPVDVHIARATFSIGIVNGQYEGNFEVAFERIRKAWFESVKGCSVGDRPMIALDVDEPLWHLSKYGRTNRDEQGNCPLFSSCEVKDYCVLSKVDIRGSTIMLNT